MTTPAAERARRVLLATPVGQDLDEVREALSDLLADAARLRPEAEVYREIARLVQGLPRRYRPQDVAQLIAESADQIEIR